MTINKSKINISKIIIISFLLFVSKWFLSFTLFPSEDNILKVINDSHSDSYMYFHYIKALSNLSFNNIFHPNLLSNKFLIIPIGSTFLHSIFLKTFGILSFIFFEFFCIFIFLLIFFLIFKELKISDQSAILFTLLIFIVPTFLSKINFLKIDEINTFVNNFYNLRFPRPLVASLYLYCFFYILI